MVASAKGGLFQIKEFFPIGYFDYLICPLDEFSRREIGTGGGYLELTHETLSSRYFITASKS